MKYIDEFRDNRLIVKLTEHIRKSAYAKYVFMEVCGGHTSSIHRFGIPSLLPGNISLISGPGCPVCVTSTDFIDSAIEYSRRDDTIIATFGDLIRVPGSSSSLEKERSEGADIRIVFSGLEALNIALMNREKKIIFLGIGFETTAPGTAVTVKEACKMRLDNFHVLSAHKIMPPAMETIIKEGTCLDGFICPGHVAAIAGSKIFKFIPEKYNIGCVISGFEPADILQAVLMLVIQVNNKAPVVETAYRRAVTPEGNVRAQEIMEEVFESRDTSWRGFGVIPQSGLKLKDIHAKIDAEKMMPLRIERVNDDPGCICGEILRGQKRPGDCTLLGKRCTPEKPVGACMVSPEGACNSFYKYSYAG